MFIQDRVFSLVWIAFLLTTTGIHLVTSEEGCLSPLGMEDKRIKDDQIRATTPRSGPSGPIYARFNHTDGNGGWCPDQKGPLDKTQYSQYIQVKLDEPVRIKGIDLQGSSKGLGKVERFFINYTPNKSDFSSWKWIGNVQEYFEGNIDSPIQRTILRPPLIADGIRLVPLFNVSKQVCMRFELLGCPLVNGLTNYNMPQGNSRQGMYNFTDLIYDGEDKKDILSNGLGFLTDGKLAPADYAVSSGLGWIGWNSKDTPAPYIIFEFLQRRIFHSMTLHCNVRDGDNIKLFSKVDASFSVGDRDAFDGSLTHSPKDVSSGSSWLNSNVKVDLCRHIGRKLKLDFTYAAEWILISEVFLKSEALGSKTPPEVQCMPVVIPPRTTVRPSDKVTFPPTTSPSKTQGTAGGSSQSKSMDGGVIAGIICAVIAVLLAVVLFICWWHYPHWFFQREKPFNHFIKVEMQPYTQYDENRRVSRLESTASECEEKRRSLRNTGSANSSRGVGGADVTACPIYSSIGADMDKESTTNGYVQYVNGFQKLHGHDSDIKPLKKVKPPVPPPLQPVHSVPEVVYAEPDTPLLSAASASPGPSPKPTIPSPLDSQTIDYTEEFPDNDYAEPHTPLVKSPTIPKSPDRSNVISGYSEPIDSISPKALTIFPNPIYEEVYSEPYQGVSGTSLYCNPDEELGMRSRQDSFRDFPRSKLYFREKIGDGQFGEVYVGEATGLGEIWEEYKNCQKATVAIKTLKPDVDKNIKNDFFKEVKAMAGLRHKNVVRLLGVCRDDPMCMIVEYMANGDLNQFLKEREPEPSTYVNQSRKRNSNSQLVSLHALFYMAKQVAAGMKYISSLNYVHRDLATRNCLVGHAYTVKIADFGMSRKLYCKHYYRVEGRVILPIRWMAPESILQGRFTTASDVWAYGVTLWEILTLAREYPYSELSDEELIKNIQASFLRSDTPFSAPPQPDTCPGDLYELMKRCWSKEPEDRPSFTELHNNLAERVRLSEASV